METFDGEGREGEISEEREKERERKRKGRMNPLVRGNMSRLRNAFILERKRGKVESQFLRLEQNIVRLIRLG